MAELQRGHLEFRPYTRDPAPDPSYSIPMPGKQQIRLYNHWIKFNYRNGKYARTDSTRSSWIADRKLAEERLQKDVDYCNSIDGWVEVESCGIVERDFPSRIVLTGKLADNGESHEDFEITIGDKELYDELYKLYYGNNVKLTMEIMPE